jgi:hypothetical protein
MSFSFDPNTGLIIVPTKVVGPKKNILINLALDTGATKTMINWDALVLIGYDPAIISNRIQMTTGSGIEYVPLIEIEQIETLGTIKTDLTIMCHTLPPSATVDGVLGWDFFRGYRLTIDFIDGFIEIE